MYRLSKEKSKKTKTLKKKAYEDWKLDNITENEFRMFSEEYKEAIKFYEEEIHKINNKKTRYKNVIEDVEWLEQLTDKPEIEELTRSVIEKFIEKIYICDEHRIIIKFNYEDKYKELTSVIKEIREEVE